MDEKESKAAEANEKADSAKLNGLEPGLAEAEAKAEEFKADLQRLQADFENFKKRAEKEKLDSALFANARLLSDFLPLLDSLDSALAAGNLSDGEKKGIALVRGQFEEILKKEGVVEIPALGKRFDSNLHECLLRGGVLEKDDGVVLEVLQKGYLFKNRVLRHAKVKVNVLEEKSARDDGEESAGGGAGEGT